MESPLAPNRPTRPERLKPRRFGLRRAAIAGATCALLTVPAAVFGQAFQVPHQFTGATPASARQLTENFAFVLRTVRREDARLRAEMERRIAEVSIALEAQIATLAFGAVPAGTIVPFAGETPPPGWLICNGDPVDPDQFPELFEVLEDAEWPSADGLLRLPDLRGQFLRGARGELGGPDPEADRAVGSPQLESFEEHGHSIPDHSHRLSTGTKLVRHHPGGSPVTFPAEVGRRTSGTGPRETGDRGGDETRPDSMAVNYIIRTASVIAP